MKRMNLLAILSLMALLTMAPPATAQSGGKGGVTTMARPGQGCWVCVIVNGAGYCTGGVPGDWNCNVAFGGGCQTSSPGCGAGAMLPLDLDGAAQYVSRGSAIGLTTVLAEGGGPPIRRNCEGVMVARYQAPENITGIRARTGSLSL
jgi:hypothetical protein